MERESVVRSIYHLISFFLSEHVLGYGSYFCNIVWIHVWVTFVCRYFFKSFFLLFLFFLFLLGFSIFDLNVWAKFRIFRNFWFLGVVDRVYKLFFLFCVSFSLYFSMFISKFLDFFLVKLTFLFHVRFDFFVDFWFFKSLSLQNCLSFHFFFSLLKLDFRLCVNLLWTNFLLVLSFLQKSKFFFHSINPSAFIIACEFI